MIWIGGNKGLSFIKKLSLKNHNWSRSTRRIARDTVINPSSCERPTKVQSIQVTDCRLSVSSYAKRRISVSDFSCNTIKIVYKTATQIIKNLQFLVTIWSKLHSTHNVSLPFPRPCFLYRISCHVRKSSTQFEVSARCPQIGGQEGHNTSTSLTTRVSRCYIQI